MNADIRNRNDAGERVGATMFYRAFGISNVCRKKRCDVIQNKAIDDGKMAGPSSTTRIMNVFTRSMVQAFSKARYGIHREQHPGCKIGDWMKFVLCVVVVCALSWPVKAVDFSGSFEKAFSDNPKRVPVVVVFGAPWCNWCRKLEYITLMDESMDEVAQDYLWVKVDTDERQDLAARHWVRGVPATIVFNAEGRPISGRSGYMNPKQFKEFLHNVLTEPETPLAAVGDLLHRIEQVSGEECAMVVTELVEVLARPDCHGREAILAALTEHQEYVVAALLESMADRRLAVRAAAWHAMQHVTDCHLEFQPFDSEAARNGQLETLRKEMEAE
ncbi:MAG: thioredoxin family protein [Pirellulaceae bacterium]|nr:thioredoxin family protein [Pirellulaceae bacterium]